MRRGHAVIGETAEEREYLGAVMTIRALVVDDSMQLRRSVMYALQRIGDIVCVEAQDGAEAIKKFQGGKFDIVLTDINMPVLDGLKLTAHLRSDPANASLPIVIITTESAQEDRERALKLGASAYLIKPVKAQEVLDTVQQLLKLPTS
jgi:two-component system chemotaxis response regulator CheY